MADITSKAAIVPVVTPNAASNANNNNNHHHHPNNSSGQDDSNSSVPSGTASRAGGGGFNSLPTSIHHGLSERLHGLTEKLQSLGKFKTSSNINFGIMVISFSGTSRHTSGDEGLRSRTGSLGTREHHGVCAGGAAGDGSAAHAHKSSHPSPTKTCSRASSKKSNHSQLIANGKLDGKLKANRLGRKSIFD